MGQTGSITEKALAAYGSLNEKIGEVSQTIRELVDPAFSEEEAREKFDYILQSIMLIVILTDRDMSLNEYNYVQQFTEYSDVFDRIFELTGTKYKWEDLIRLSGKDHENLMRIARDIAIQESEDVIRLFAAVDAVLTVKNDSPIMDDFFIPMQTILAGISAIDGEQTGMERHNASHAFRDIFYDRWMDFKDGYEKEIPR